MIKEPTFCKLYTAVDVITVYRITFTHRPAVISIKRIWTLEATILSKISLVTSFTNNIDSLINYNKFKSIIFPSITAISYKKNVPIHLYCIRSHLYPTQHTAVPSNLQKAYKKHDYVNQHIRTWYQKTLYTLTHNNRFPE